MHYNDRAEAKAQEPSAKKLSGPNGHKARDEFICAVVACDGLTPLELKIAVRLAIYFNCTTGQCNPGYPALAKAIGVATRSARRAVASLVDYGIVAVDQSAGGSHDQKSKFSLFMPPARVTHPRSPVTGDEPDTRPASGRVTRTNGTGDEQTPGRVTPRGPHNTEKENTESNHEERAYGPRSSGVEIQSPSNSAVTAADDESQSPALNTDIPDNKSAPTERRLVSSRVEKDQAETHSMQAPCCPIPVCVTNGANGATPELPGKAFEAHRNVGLGPYVRQTGSGAITLAPSKIPTKNGAYRAIDRIGQAARRPDTEPQNEVTKIMTDAIKGAGFMLRKLTPEESQRLARRRESFAKLREKYRNQPAAEAAEVEVLFNRMLLDRHSFTPLMNTFARLGRDLNEGRIEVENMPTLKTILQENWQRVHESGRRAQAQPIEAACVAA